jgi:hypothetical protein
MLPAGSTACTNWVQSSNGAYLQGRTNYQLATFTTRISTSIGGPETTIFSALTREVQVHYPGNDYPTYNVLIQPPTAGTYFIRNCVTASSGPVYVFKLRIKGNGPGLADVGPHQATLGPGGRHCGDWVEGPSIGLDDGATRLVAGSNVPVLFYLSATDDSYGYAGPVFTVTGTGIDQVYVPAANISSLSGCVENTSSTTATVSFELTAV